MTGAPPDRRKAAIAELEQRLGHDFQDRGLLERALTHASAGDGGREVLHNERLEFLGDRVLNLVAAQRLMLLHPDEREGELSKRMHGLVSRDACEALLAAVYLDAGLERAADVFAEAWALELEAVQASGAPNPKSDLQEWAAARRLPQPSYAVADRSGPDHAPTFTVELVIGDLTPATGQGRSRQEAEKAAAEAMLAREVRP